MSKFTVGQTVLLAKGDEVLEFPITRVGSVWAHIEIMRMWSLRFKHTEEHPRTNGPQFEVFVDKAEMDAVRTRQASWLKFKRVFHSTHRVPSHLTLEQIESMTSMLKGTQ